MYLKYYCNLTNMAINAKALTKSIKMYANKNWNAENSLDIL